MRTVDGVSDGVAPAALATPQLGNTVNVAATLAVARNSRRDMGGVFMTGQYSGKARQANADFRLLKRFN